MAETTRAQAMEKREDEESKEEFHVAFERVRLVRAWVAVAVAIASMLSAYAALVERVVKW